MSNRSYTNQAFHLEKAVVELFATVSFGAAGAPTISRTGFASQGVVSVTHDGTGLYTFVFGTQAGMLDVYNQLKSVHVVFNTVGSAAVPAAPIYYISSDLVATPASCSLQLTFLDADTPAVTDPASGEVGLFTFKFKNSNAP